MKTVARVCLCTLLCVSFAAAASAQDPKSAALAKQLSAALDAGQLDSIAAKDPSNPDTFIGALYFKGVQLLLVSAKYSAPSLLEDKLGKKDYRNVYIDLNSASVPDSKVFIEDLGADGLQRQARRQHAVRHVRGRRQAHGVRRRVEETEALGRRLQESVFHRRRAVQPDADGTAGPDATCVLAIAAGSLLAPWDDVKEGLPNPRGATWDGQG